MAKKLCENVESLMLRGYEKTLRVTAGSVKDVSIQATRSNVPISFRTMVKGRWTVKSAQNVYVGMLMVII